MDYLILKILERFRLLLLFYIFYGYLVKCSEFPERECCDPIYSPPKPSPLPPPIVVLPTITTLSSPTVSLGRSGKRFMTKNFIKTSY